MIYRISQIASIVKGTIGRLHNDAEVKELLTDSRKVIFPECSLFFALKGPRRDGHEFVKEAYRKGVRSFVISDPLETDLPEVNLVVVKDVLAALQVLTAYHRSRFTIPVIGITGSNGKTIVKEWLNQLLEERFRIVRSPKSYNSQLGVPLSVWQMNESAEMAIIEAGISQSGEMENLQKIIRPTIGVFTNIGDAHAAGFLHTQQKIREKLRLFTNADTLIYGKDDPDVNESMVQFYQQVKAGAEKPVSLFCWSTSGTGDLQVNHIQKQPSQTTIQAVYREETIAITIPFTDDASIENAITCWCVLLHLQLPHDEIARNMARLHPVAMRLELKDGINNTSVINDSYSADLSSLKIALDFLDQQHQHPRRTVILADFLDSGRNEKELYHDIAHSLNQHRVDRFIGIGPVITRNEAVFRELAAGGASFKEIQFFDSVQEFMYQFPRISFADETILIKGARVFALEQINQLLEKQTHQTRLEIDLGALLFNLRQYQQLLKPSTRLMAMVKAFSYGSGSYEIASALQFNKVDYLTVAYADEGVELRRGGITLPVMVMNTDVSSFNTLVNYNLEPEVYSLPMIRSLERFLKNEGLAQFPVHVELETGMNRLGFGRDDLGELAELLSSNLFKVQTVFSHLVGSEDPALDDFTRRQAAVFTEMSDFLAGALAYSFSRHLLNTSGIARHPSLQFDMVRIGIGLYGIDSSNTLELKEVSTLKSSVAQVKHLKAGESVSYGRGGMLGRDSVIATVRLGYADGYPRRLGEGRGLMLVNGRPAPTVGRVCMDMTMIDVTDAGSVREGDEVIVFGRGLPVSELAHRAQTIPYEILTGISQRVKRVYFQE